MDRDVWLDLLYRSPTAFTVRRPSGLTTFNVRLPEAPVVHVSTSPTDTQPLCQTEYSAPAFYTHLCDVLLHSFQEQQVAAAAAQHVTPAGVNLSSPYEQLRASHSLLLYRWNLVRRHIFQQAGQLPSNSTFLQVELDQELSSFRALLNAQRDRIDELLARLAHSDRQLETANELLASSELLRERFRQVLQDRDQWRYEADRLAHRLSRHESWD